MLKALKRRAWDALAGATPIPTLVRPRTSDVWQRHWREKMPDTIFPGYAKSTPIKRWLAEQIVGLNPSSVLEFGCNVGGNLREVCALSPSIKTYGIELNERAIAWGKANAISPSSTVFQGSMADAKSIMSTNGVDNVDVVFTSAAAMHCDDGLFGSAKSAALDLADRAIVHNEFHAWTPADLHNGRNWRSSFLSDRWIRDYVGEYDGHPRVARIETYGIPLKVNFMDNIGKLMISDMTGLVVVHLKPRAG